MPQISCFLTYFHLITQTIKFLIHKINTIIFRSFNSLKPENRGGSFCCLSADEISISARTPFPHSFAVFTLFSATFCCCSSISEPMEKFTPPFFGSHVIDSVFMLLRKCANVANSLPLSFDVFHRLEMTCRSG